MSYICQNCGKSTIAGRSQKHGRGVAGKRWKKRAPKTLRVFKPNLQQVMVISGGKKVSMRLCAKCLKRFKKDKKIPSYTKLALG